MPIIEVVGIGDVELPDGMSKEQMAEALNKLPKPKFTPTAQNRGNVINTDVPTVVGERPNAVNPQPVTKPVTMMDRVKALYEVPTALASEAIRQPLAHAYGVAESIPHAIVEEKAPAELGQKYTAQALQAIPQYQPTSPVSQEVLGTIGSVAEAAKLPPYLGNIGAIPSFVKTAGAAKPIMQEIITPAAKNIASALRNEAGMVKEAMQPAISTVTETAKPVVNKVAEALRREPKVNALPDLTGIAPSAEELAQKSSNLFKQAKESGVELNAKDFADNMAAATKELRNEGYDPRLYPKLGIAVEELTNAQIPKDFNELSTLRKFIQNAQKSADPQERRLATTLKDDFDAYVSRIPDTSVVGGNKQALADWKEARDAYAKLSKSEIFTDMLEKAELDKSKFTQSGAENSMAMQLRKLAENPKRMRLFTKSEQEAIKQAAKGGDMQKLLRFYGKFTPSGPVSGIFAGGLIASNPMVGIPLELGAIAARRKATKMRKEDIEKLAALMRSGKGQ